MEQQTVNDDSLFEASDVGTVANESTTEQAENMDSSAVEATNEQTDSENDATDEPAVAENETPTQTGDAIDEFLAKKGIDKNDPEALRKVADMYRNSEKGFYSKSQEAAQLQRKLAETAKTTEMRPDLQALSEVRSMRIKMDTSEWKASHHLSQEDEVKMVDYVSQPLVDERGNVRVDQNGAPLTRAVLVNNGVISLDDVYKLAGCGEQKVDNLKQAYRDEVRKEMAAHQAAKRPSSNATDSTQFGKAEESDPFLDGLFG